MKEFFTDSALYSAHYFIYATAVGRMFNKERRIAVHMKDILGLCEGRMLVTRIIFGIEYMEPEEKLTWANENVVSLPENFISPAPRFIALICIEPALGSMALQ